jgi:hypothetical protein
VKVVFKTKALFVLIGKSLRRPYEHRKYTQGPQKKKINNKNKNKHKTQQRKNPKHPNKKTLLKHPLKHCISAGYNKRETSVGSL